MSPFVPFSSGATLKESNLDPLLCSIGILKRFSKFAERAARMGLLGHLARPLTPNPGVKAIVFLGRDNGLPWNAALDARVGSFPDVGPRPQPSPLIPQQRTCSICIGMSAKCQKRKLASYSITSSARAETDGGMVSPIALAVFKLMTNLKWVGPSIGNSPGAVPRKINATKFATRRSSSVKSGP